MKRDVLERAKEFLNKLPDIEPEFYVMYSDQGLEESIGNMLGRDAENISEIGPITLVPKRILYWLRHEGFDEPFDCYIDLKKETTGFYFSLDSKNEEYRNLFEKKVGKLAEKYGFKIEHGY